MAKAVIQKNWYEVQAPEIFSEDIITETPAEKDSQVHGRTVKEDLTQLMNGGDKYYVDVELQVTDVEGNKAFTEISGMECSSEFVSRMVRKRSDRMDLVHSTETSDGRTVRVKVVAATIKKTSSQTLTEVRNTLKQVIDGKASEHEYETFMESIFNDELQEEMRDEAEAIYPFREMEVRKTELVK